MGSNSIGPNTGLDALTATALSQLSGTIVLNCLGKQPGPPTLAGDLVHVLELPEPVRLDLWSVLEPNLGAVNTPRSNQVVEAFCARQKLDPRSITPVIGACRFLFQRGAEHDTPPALIEEDIAALLRSEKIDDAGIAKALACVVPCYVRAAAQLRARAIHEAVTDHGKVVTDVKWRVDDVRHANTGEAIHVPVTMLTLRYREGGENGQVTVQLLPDELAKLRQACEEALR